MTKIEYLAKKNERMGQLLTSLRLDSKEFLSTLDELQEIFENERQALKGYLEELRNQRESSNPSDPT